MRALIDRVARAMRVLAPQGARVIAAVSGGPDSVAMTHLLRGLARQGTFELAGIAHFNHRLRPDADADAAFCHALAANLGLPFYSEAADVAGEARVAKTSVEATARRLRYAFLEKARRAAAADFIAVGHTRDDQAETFLLRLLRGAGTRGLRGIHRARGAIIRPLLDIGRGELHEWLSSEGHPFRTDVSNADTAIPRNRVRHDLLPMLERFSPGSAEILARTASLASEDEDYLGRGAIEASATIVSEEETRLALDLDGLKSLHPSLARRVVRDAMARVAPGRFVGLAHVDAVLALAGGRLDLPGQRVLREGNRLVLTTRTGRSSPVPVTGTNVFRYALSIPGEAEIPECGVAISSERLTELALGADTPADGVLVDPEAVAEGLAVRGRRPGDRFRPPGLGGTKKLQDYFVDRKVPRSQRDRVPLVVDGRDRIVWVVGHAVADDFRVMAPRKAVLLLKVRYLGGTV
jgi:tRNA(Ile)-lysidine synthase